jgi:hypothetical protein
MTYNCCSRRCSTCNILFLHVGVTYKSGFGLDDWIYWHLIRTTRDYRQYSAISVNTHFAVHRSTRTRILSLHQSSPGNGFIVVSLSLQITREVFFAPSSSFLALILWLPIPKTRLNSIPLLPSSYPGRLAPRNSTLHFRLLFSTRSRLLCLFITPRHGPHRKHSLYC